MDPRRFLIPALGGLLLSGCAIFRPGDADIAVTPLPASLAPALQSDTPLLPPLVDTIGNHEAPQPGEGSSTFEQAGSDPSASSTQDDPNVPLVHGANDRAADQNGEAAPTGDHRVGALQMFEWTPGRVYEVRAAPLRVTTLTLGLGETLLGKAAGDTVRWQIGETTSGSGAGLRTHVLLKPLERGLATNLVLTTNRRVYFVDLRSGSADRFNPAVAWQETIEDLRAERRHPATSAEPLRIADPVVVPEGPLDARYRISPQGRRPRWTPASVLNDGQRTFITFDANLQIDEAPTLFVIAPDGERQMTNYRQAGGLFIVDRVFDRAELRLGNRRPQVVHLHRLQGGRP